jgi:phosphate:Na+ symporter
VVNGVLFLPLTGFLKKMVLIILPTSEEEEAAPVANLDKRILATPPIAIGQTEEYFSKTAGLILNMFNGAEKLLEKKEQDVDEVNKLETKFTAYSKQLAQQSREMNRFLVSLAQKDLTEQQSKQVTRLLYLTKDLEILCYQLKKLANILCEQFEESFMFEQEAREELFICFSRVRELYEHANLEINLTVTEAEKIKHTIYSNSMLDKAARNNHLHRIKQGKQNALAGIAFLDALRTIGNMLSSIEHLTEHKQFKF